MKTSLEKYREYGRRIEDLIRPATFPLAVKIVRPEDEIAPEYKRPFRDLGVQNFVCQNFKMARTYGWTIAVTGADINCKLARALYGWDTLTDQEREWAEDFSVGLYSKDRETAGKFGRHLYALDEPFAGLIISPLTRTKIVPDTVLVYCLPAQAMRFVQGYLFMEGGVLEFAAAGRVGSCHEGVTKVLKTGRPQYVTLGNGDRVWGGAHDHEVMFACPAEKLDVLMEGLETTHAAGLRYPIPQYMNYAPGFQASFEKAAVQRAGGTIEKK
ncbi:DUF169 domain-containing protein [Desulfosudis oleivorans]|uniref:DUF169 domain-containing protein n=1 Tax=Desulfosudis oleivorans (strain DSM 6200 / JCM 39069 / Hxd3) TaxID=96561 RepID=A8ZWM6_DESOH|nr:DUF169 domain-containing protein [Desulfosudis oleivorans]ABW68357.1 protein of unknown function DUF169 [Desulfosudis oleivorans Hxd3]